MRFENDLILLSFIFEVLQLS